MKWPIDHWLVWAAQLPNVGIVATVLMVAAVELVNLVAFEEVMMSSRRASGMAMALAVVGLAWAPVTVGGLLYWRGGRAGPWLTYGALPACLTLSFLFFATPALYPLIAGAWLLAVPAIVAGRRYGKTVSALPPLPTDDPGI